MFFIGAIDQGTSSTRFIVFDERGTAVASHQVEYDLVTVKPGWVELDPHDITRTTLECMRVALAQFRERYGDAAVLRAVGITNQRETTVAWDRRTGEPLCPALVWLDMRTESIVKEMSEKHGGQDAFRDRTGLPFSTYFSNVEEVASACAEGNAAFGTVDSWLIWNLTGGKDGGVHVTDVTNASRTLLMDIKTLQWDDSLCAEFGVPRQALPEIRSSSEVYGSIGSGFVDAAEGVPIAGCLGDQQAALFGQMCFERGTAKNTYGTGCFMLFNTGTSPVRSDHGLLTTVAYQLGSNDAVYALEGSIAVAGIGVKWLRDSLGLIKSAPEIDVLAASVGDTGGVTFVPAFSGLFAPHWRSEARGLICGMTQYTRREHICRALLEAVCFQTKEILEAMNLDSGVPLLKLSVDGGMAVSDVMLQIQADLLDIPIERRRGASVMTALGAAMAAGLAVGVWPSVEALRVCQPELDRAFTSAIEEEERVQRYAKWKHSVAKA